MEHKILNLQNLYEDSKRLLNTVVKVENDNMLSDINMAINNLKNTWKGKDAGVQIMNIISTYNSLIKVRNSLSSIAVNCMEISSKYRGIQHNNKAAVEQFIVLRDEEKSTLQGYSDNTETLSILPEADNARISLEKAVVEMEKLLVSVRTYKDRIFSNWVSGGRTREDAFSVFEEFIATANVYKDVLGSTANSIKTALTNYNF